MNEATEPAAAGAGSNPPIPDPEASGPEAAESPFLALEALVKDSEDRYLRLLAEFDNFRRRALRERDAAMEAGTERLARSLLGVLDNLERAMEHAPSGDDPWVGGVAMTLRQFREAMASAGVAVVDPAGEPFDPGYHEAIASAPSTGVPADHVVTVVARGYRLGQRVLRPAQVIVSSGPGPDPAP